MTDIRSHDADTPPTPLRLALLGIFHEANTFLPELVSTERLESFAMQRGAEMVRINAGAETSIAGYLEAAAEAGAEAVPLVYSAPLAEGPIARDAFEKLLAEMSDALRAHGPWDGVLLVLHGASVAEDHLDSDGDALALVRGTVGQDVPIGVGFDMHGNLSERMGRLADVLIGFRTNPHVDARARALEVGRLVIAAARGRCRPVTVVHPVPAVINIARQATDGSPMRELLALAAEVEARPGILSTSIAEGFPYADVPEMGMSVVVVADGDVERAAAEAERLAAAVWERREDFHFDGMGVAEAIAHAGRAERPPVLLLDVGDNMGGGGPGDSAVLLLEAMRQGVAPVLTIVVHAEGAAAAHATGVGGRVTVSLRDGERGRAAVEGEVVTLGDGRYEERETSHAGQRYYDAGPSAVVRLADDSVVVLISKRSLPSSLQQLANLDVDPRAFRAIVAKGVNSPLAAYAPVCGESVFVDTPGVTSADLSRFEYRHRPRPLFPFEPVEGG